MPEEKRKEYVKDQESKKTEAQGVSESDEKRKMRSTEARKQASMAKGKSLSDNMIYCVIQEIGAMGKEETEVRIVRDPGFESILKEVGVENKYAIGVLMEKRKYSNALQAVNNFSKNGWELVNSSVYTQKDMVVREYLMGMTTK